MVAVNLTKCGANRKPSASQQNKNRLATEEAVLRKVSVSAVVLLGRVSWDRRNCTRGGAGGVDSGQAQCVVGASVASWSRLGPPRSPSHD